MGELTFEVRFGELRGQLARPVEGRWQARLAEVLCGIYDVGAGRFEEEVAPYVREALGRIALGAVEVLSAVETAQVLERGAVAGLMGSLTLDGAYGEGLVLAWERLGPGSLVRGLEQLRVEGVLWGKARRAQLVGTRAGSLLGIVG